MSLQNAHNCEVHSFLQKEVRENCYSRVLLINFDLLRFWTILKEKDRSGVGMEATLMTGPLFIRVCLIYKVMRKISG